MGQTCVQLLAMLENHAGKQSGQHLCTKSGWPSWPPYFFLRRCCTFFFETMTCNTSLGLDFLSCRQYVGKEVYCKGWCERRYEEPPRFQNAALPSNFIASAFLKHSCRVRNKYIVGLADTKSSQIWDGGEGRPNNLKRRSCVFLFSCNFIFSGMRGDVQADFKSFFGQFEFVLFRSSCCIASVWARQRPKEY